MNLAERKKLTADIPEDLKPGEEIEVSNDAVHWHVKTFSRYNDHGWIQDREGLPWILARRPAPQLKRIEDESWPGGAIRMYVNSYGECWYVDSNEGHHLIDGKYSPSSQGIKRDRAKEEAAKTPKTVREWLETLPDGYRENALKNLNDRLTDTRFDNPRDALEYAFRWDETPQGTAYWYSVHSWLCKAYPVVSKITEYREWTVDEAREKWVKIKGHIQEEMLVHYDSQGHKFYDGEHWVTTKQLLETHVQPDGSPCGVRV